MADLPSTLAMDVIPSLNVSLVDLFILEAGMRKFEKLVKKYLLDLVGKCLISLAMVVIFDLVESIG